MLLRFVNSLFLFWVQLKIEFIISISPINQYEGLQAVTKKFKSWINVTEFVIHNGISEILTTVALLQKKTWEGQSS